MPMRIPQPIQIWFNSLHHYRKTHRSGYDTTLINKFNEKLFITNNSNNNNNPLLIGGLENLLLEMIPSHTKLVNKDGAREVAQWICENLIMLYNVNEEDYYTTDDINNQLDQKKKPYDDAQLITIELLPTIIYVYFCLFIFLETIKTYQKQSIIMKPELKLNKIFNFNKFPYTILKQNEEDTTYMTITQFNYLMNKKINLLKSIKKRNNFQLHNNNNNNNNNNELSLKLNNQFNLSKLIKPRHKQTIHTENVPQQHQQQQQQHHHHHHQQQQQQIKTKSLFNYWTNEYIDLLNIFEVYLLIIYKIYQINHRNNLDDEKLHINFDTIMLHNPSVYCDALMYRNENNKVENLSNHFHVTKSINQCNTMKELNEFNKMKHLNKEFNEYTLNSYNRMRVLTTLMKEYSAYSPSCISKQSRVSLCKLACLFNPFRNQNLENLLSQFEEFDSVDDNDDEHTPDINSMKLESINENEKQNDSASEKIRSLPTSPKKFDKTDNQASKGIQQFDKQPTIKRQMRSCRVTGLSPNFILEILFSIYPVLYTEQSDLAYEAIKSLKARATYELWPNVLLLIESIEKDYARSKSPDLNSFTLDKQMINQQVLNNTEENKLNSEQLSLASAYCGLWSGLLDKRSDFQHDTTIPEPCDIQDLSGKRLHYVRLAQAKFKRPVVTNSNFKTVKLPDDITPLSPNDSTLIKQNEKNKDYYLTYENAYLKRNRKSSLDELLMTEDLSSSTQSFTREWFKKTLWKDRQSEKS
ncbi:hypothetical protein MN116_004730 [Schistosoma mekongi]|uniref:Uncharacterized protein n=1 Tax=Schistosoma mekongi TaxID=38744 RepID=A0AAE1ZD83_SCHME|nr:hypothetical protein MN116_004730 [Schistosoma mekongi]